MPSFHAVCGPDESVKCGPDLGHSNFAIWVTSPKLLLSQLFLECVAGLNDRKGCIFTNDMKLTRQNMKYFVFILSAMKYKSK